MKSQLARFSSIGILNTAVDFLLFALLTNIVGLHFIVANVLSTGSALGLSFYLNGKLTFRTALTSKGIVLFFVTTLVGLWVLQPLVITLSEPFIRPLLLSIGQEDTSLIVAKIIATLFSLTWNFVLYKYVVFRDKPHNLMR